MCKTRHIQQRMSQRGIKEEMLKIAISFGKKQQDKIILNRKSIDSLLSELEKMKKNAIKLRERGGLMVIDVNDYLVTTYALDSYKK